MKFDIKNAPTMQELVEFDSVCLRERKFHLRKGKIGVGLSIFGFMLLYGGFIYNLETVGQHAVFYNTVASVLFCVLLFTFSKYKDVVKKCWQSAPIRNSQKVVMFLYPTLVNDIQTDESKSYIQMINRQGRDICYFDYYGITEWEAEYVKKERYAQRTALEQNAYEVLRAI